MRSVRFISVFFLLFLLLPQQACQDNKHVVPYEYVNFFISLNDPKAFNLRIPGGYIYVTGGVRGIIVYHSNEGEYMAFDQCCTFDPADDHAQVEVDASGTVAVCPVCNSQFALPFEGAVMQGPATWPLKQYTCTFDPYEEMIYVTN